MLDDFAPTVAAVIDVAPTIDTECRAPASRRQTRWPMWSAIASGLLHAAMLVGLGWWALPTVVPPAGLTFEWRTPEELPQLEDAAIPVPLQATVALAGADEAASAAALLTAAASAVEQAQSLSPLAADALATALAELAAAGPTRPGAAAAGSSDPARRPIKFFDAPVYPAQRSFVFVVDASGSMHGSRFDRARRELMATLEQLEPTQRFYVVFFNEYDFPQFHPQRTREYLAATPDNLRRMQAWMGTLRAAGDTHPMSALRKGLELRPDALYLLSDGAFELRTLSLIRQFNKHGTTIHTIGLEDPSGETLLKAIADENAGGYHFVK